LWKLFDKEATANDLALLGELGANCVRVFLTFESFYSQPGHLNVDGLEKFEQFLDLAQKAGLYVHPTGPDHWEGLPTWAQADRYADDVFVAALEEFWRAFAARFRGCPAILAYDLLNEPSVPWDTPAMKKKWGRPVPEAREGEPELLAYQQFRESIAEEWTRRQVKAIKAADPDALVTVGLIQWSVPVLLPRLGAYSAFRPARIEQHLDFIEIHFYPLDPPLHYAQDEVMSNLAYLHSLLQAVGAFEKPVVIAELGWYGGGSFGDHPAASEADQADWCAALVRASEGLACGWLNWGFYDQPEARDVSVLTGLLRADGTPKAWGRRFAEVAREVRGARMKPGPIITPHPEPDWDACVTSLAAGNAFRDAYRKAYNTTEGTEWR
jgi:endo-1,4-beta-mannosidase